MGNYIYNLGLLFRKVASEHKENDALVFIDRRISYHEIELVSNRIAHFLIAKNVVKGQVIAIFNDKSPLSYSTMLACLKIGAIYTNLDSKSPASRLSKMIDLCNPALFFSFEEEDSVLESLSFDNSKIIYYSSLGFHKSLNSYSDDFPLANVNVTGNNPAYLMFTSGSTGFPKGVVITHSNVINFINWSKETYSSTSNDIYTNINPMHFDNSVFDFYSSLFTGASLIPVSEDLVMNPRKLIEVFNVLKPTIWFSVPSMLVYVLKLRALRDTDLLSLRIITFGGEGFPKNQLRNLWGILGERVTFVNVYGPTECTCICSSYTVKQNDLEMDELLPLGPISHNFDFLIMNQMNEVLAADEVGELCIMGPNVGLGYYNNLEKTSEVFVQNPTSVSHKEIMYKSGDLVRYDSKNNLLHFHGRIDNQIKRMGYRIELEEIEYAIGSLDYVIENAVIFSKNETDNGKIIVCLHSDNKDEQSFLQDLSKLIPSYMLPNELIFYDNLPKNQNGKIDRIKLKEEYLNGK